MSKKPKLAPAAGPIIQVLLATLPLWALLIYFLVEASRRPHCYNIADDDAVREDLYSGECARLVPLSDMLYVYLAFGQLWALLAVYLTIFVPRRQQLVWSYFREGESTLGDVYYDEQAICTCCSNNYGFVTYPHPNYNTYPVYIRREVRIFERYTRERVTILMLPGKPYSGHAQSDLEIDAAVFQRNSRKMAFLTAYSWIWVAFCLGAPIYIMLVLNNIHDDLEYAENFWLRYVIIVAAVIPLVSFGLNWITWKRHEYWFVQQGKVCEEGERRDGGTGGFCCGEDDLDHVNYDPPTPPGSSPVTPASSVLEQSRPAPSVSMTNASWTTASSIFDSTRSASPSKTASLETTSRATSLSNSQAQSASTSNEASVSSQTDARSRMTPSTPKRRMEI